MQPVIVHGRPGRFSNPGKLEQQSLPAMPLHLTYQADTNVPVEIEGFTPEAVAGASLDEVRRVEIFHGNRTVPLGEMFDVTGDTRDLEWHLEGDLSGVHWIGAHMRAGSIRVHGSAGRHLGSQMQGGMISVDGDAGDWVGPEMRGGMIRVAGNVGDLAGAAYRGSPRGMTGGTIVVHGNAGDELGHTMRRGWIAVGGDCGDLPGFGMLAGSIVVLGKCGIRPGAGMRRGTLALLGDARVKLLPTFRFACRQQPVVLGLLQRQLGTLGLPLASSTAGDVDIFNGDLLAGGRGEVLVVAG
jgi:formylmethanofuran dehydrogenase subunit C